MKKQGLPKKYDVVICKVTKLFPNSATVEMIEYGKSGMVHVSEVASRWVRDIREFLKPNQIVTCRVMRVDGDQVSLSIKRVHKEEAASTMNAYNREKKAEKWLELAAQKQKKTLEQAYKEVGDMLIEEFGSLFKAFDVAAKKQELLKQKGITKMWIEPITEIAKKSIADKTFTFKANLNISVIRPDGIDVIQKALGSLDKTLSVKYIAAPKYVLSITGKNPKELEKKLHEATETVEKQVRAAKGEFAAEFVKN
ncbi:MAG: S1 RNA-binding domain-containing protein [Nanoarchaeota archaeon]|nr:S1 RNA-binding domain-containing protein [Nanoarchaeota archaeon]